MLPLPFSDEASLSVLWAASTAAVMTALEAVDDLKEGWMKVNVHNKTNEGILYRVGKVTLEM